MSRPRRSAAVLVAASVALLPAGCSFWAPNTVFAVESPSDGVNGEIGDLDIRNILVVADEEGGPGNVSAVLFNSGLEPLEVSLTAVPNAASPFEATVTVPPQTGFRLGPDGDEQVLVPAVGVVPGKLLPMQVGTPDAGTIDLQVPVLRGELEQYESLVPDATATSPTGTPTGAATPTTPGAPATPASTGAATAPGGEAVAPGAPATSGPTEDPTLPSEFGANSGDSPEG